MISRGGFGGFGRLTTGGRFFGFSTTGLGLGLTTSTSGNGCLGLTGSTLREGCFTFFGVSQAASFGSALTRSSKPPR